MSAARKGMEMPTGTVPGGGGAGDKCDAGAPAGCGEECGVAVK